MVYERLRELGIATQLHYIPIYRHTLYRELGYGGLTACLPEAERYYASALSLPIFPTLEEAGPLRVRDALARALAEPLVSVRT
jgi:dTDP-4-amino-4,6-dideoxygalactose transaminase